MRQWLRPSLPLDQQLCRRTKPPLLPTVHPHQLDLPLLCHLCVCAHLSVLGGQPQVVGGHFCPQIYGGEGHSELFHGGPVLDAQLWIGLCLVHTLFHHVCSSVGFLLLLLVFGARWDHHK